MDIKMYGVYPLSMLARMLANEADRFVINVEDRNGNELYVVEDVGEANSHSVQVRDISESEVNGLKIVEVTVADLDWEDW